MDSVALALFRFFSRTRQNAGAAVRAPGAAPHPHPHECNYANNIVSAPLSQAIASLEPTPINARTACGKPPQNTNSEFLWGA